MSDVETMLARYAADIDSGKRLLPDEFVERCGRLATTRGLSQRIVTDLAATDDADLLRQCEALSDDEIAALNEASAASEAAHARLT